MMIHLRNGRAGGHSQTRGTGVTWCGKKLLGGAEVNADGFDTFTSYGNVLVTTLDPVAGTCPHCRAAFDAAYNNAFPEGLTPIATFRADNPHDMARAKAALSPEALTRIFGAGGGGMAEFEAALRGEADVR